MSFTKLFGLLILIIGALIVIISYFISKRCPKCGSIITFQEQKALFRQEINGNKEFLVTYRCKKCNNFWSKYITENNKH